MLRGKTTDIRNKSLGDFAYFVIEKNLVIKIGIRQKVQIKTTSKQFSVLGFDEDLRRRVLHFFASLFHPLLT